MAGGKKNPKKPKGPQSMVGFRLKKDLDQQIIDKINMHYMNGKLGEYMNDALVVYDLMERQNLLPLILQGRNNERNDSGKKEIDPNIENNEKSSKENSNGAEIAMTKEAIRDGVDSIKSKSIYDDTEDEIFGGGCEKLKEPGRVNFIKRLQENMENQIKKD